MIATQTLITIAIVLAIYAVLQKIFHKKQINQKAIKEEYVKILNSQEYKVK